VTGLLSAWIVSMGILSWDQVTKDRQAPVPGTLVAASVVFALLGFVSEVAPTPAALMGWGLVAAQAIAFGTKKAGANTATTKAGATAAANV
jgi:uncharacterized membrane protein HdeD (DUF308 family)